MLFSTLAVALITTAASAASVNGTVTNRTTGKPSAGDAVVLLNVAGMQEIQHARTDARGRFTLDIPPGDGVQLIRVTHDQANYFMPVQPGTDTLAVDVYTASDKVDGIVMDADVMRIQSAPGNNGLRVVEHFFEKNVSSPPETLNGDRSFEIYLPPGAIVEGAAARSPNGLAVQVPVQPGSEPNQYAVAFPIRPGQTEVQFTYRLPYSGTFEFKPRPMLPTNNLIVMLPRSMTFKAASGTPYAPVAEETSAQTYAASNVQPSQPLSFTISGTGELPRDPGPQAATGPGAAAPDQSPADSADSNKNHLPGVGLANPLDNAAERESWVSKYKWFLIGGIGLLLVAGAGILLSSGARNVPAGLQPGLHPGLHPGQSGAALQVLRDEMFAVETERLEGKLTEQQYQELKSAFDIVLRRALSRSGQTGVPL